MICGGGGGGGPLFNQYPQMLTSMSDEGGVQRGLAQAVVPLRAGLNACGHTSHA